jgi:predicted nucleic acid-binding protein
MKAAATRMPFVLDASVAAGWILPDEQNESSNALMRGLNAEPAIVPSLFWFEVRNLFLIAERRGRLNPGGALGAMIQLRNLGIQEAASDDDEFVLKLARRHALSAYDASYLALSLAHQIPIATRDKKMTAAARFEDVAVLGASASH